MRFLFLLAVMCLAVSSCGPDPKTSSPLALETDAGEAVVRQVLSEIPELPAPHPKVYCLLVGPNLWDASEEFEGRFEDLELSWVKGKYLQDREPNHLIIDPKSGTSPVMIQLTKVETNGSEEDVLINAAWAFKQSIVRRVYQAKKQAGEDAQAGWEAWKVESIELVHEDVKL